MLRKLLIPVVVLGLAATAALGQEPIVPIAPKVPVITQPEWVRRPTTDQMWKFWSYAALKAGKSGEVLLQCAVTVTGNVHRCTVVRESPEEFGFGASALMMSSLFQLKPMMVNGAPMESTVQFPIHFRCDGCSGLAVTSKFHYRNPPWFAAPTFEEWKTAYPAKAKEKGASGSVNLQCEFGKEGAVRNCSVEAENPRNLGFGAAARSLVTRFKGLTVDAEGAPTVGSSVSITIAWPNDAVAGTRPKGRPQFFKLPTTADLQGAFPRAAADEGIDTGSAILRCGLSEGGALANCQIDSETPAGKGFGQAALSLASTIRLSHWSSDGQPIARSLLVPISFRPREAEDAAAPAK